MNADLEETLDELGPDYRSVVRRLKAWDEAREMKPAVLRVSFRRCALLAASCAAICLAVVSVLQMHESTSSGRAGAPSLLSSSSPYILAYEESPAAIDEILRTQAADGSWANDFLTRQNAAALREVAEAQIAYRKAVRYLRAKGLSPMSADELHARGRHPQI